MKINQETKNKQTSSRITFDNRWKVRMLDISRIILHLNGKTQRSLGDRKSTSRKFVSVGFFLCFSMCVPANALASMRMCNVNKKKGKKKFLNTCSTIRYNFFSLKSRLATSVSTLTQWFLLKASAWQLNVGYLETWLRVTQWLGYAFPDLKIHYIYFHFNFQKLSCTDKSQWQAQRAEFYLE